MPAKLTPMMARATFWSKVDIRTPSECWLWFGSTQDNGYGVASSRPCKVYAHRYAYEHTFGPVPAGLEIDHVKTRGCTSRRCCNPAHLEAVTKLENIRRGESPYAMHARQTHCVRGHELAGDNLAPDPRGPGLRKCRKCHNDRNLQSYHRLKRQRFSLSKAP